MSYRFGDFVVDTTSFSLSRAGRDIPVQPKVFDLLCYLIEHRDRVVTKQELLNALWQEPQVDEFGVPWTVSHARRALGQDTGAQCPIQTVRGRGYRFVAEVSELAHDASSPETGRTTQPAMDPNPFVGRDPLMEQLEAHLSRAKDGAGSFCLLAGEAGIGKTRCLDELSARARALDFSVWTSRSIEATYGPVFWPWIQILRALLRDQPSLAEAGEALVARLMTHPEVVGAEGTMLRARAPAPAMASQRFWQYEAVVDLLRAASRARPLMLSFDDLHWADAGTSELLGFLMPDLRHLPILIVGARREDRRATGRDRRSLPTREATRFKLGTLSTLDVGRYLQLYTGVPQPSPALCEAVQTVSAGNPWFLRETVNALLLEYGPAALNTLDAQSVQPAGAVIDRLRGRIATLSAEAQAVLRLACVLGDRFEIELVLRMGEASIDGLLAALEEARAEGLISIDPARYGRFYHGLLRSVLYEDLAVPERLRFHLAAAVALEKTLDPLHYGEIAHHYHCSLPLPKPALVVAAALRAAGAAARARAFADAAQFLEWACAAQLTDPGVGPRERAELWLQRATTERLAGREARARESATSVIELAREHGYLDLLVRAAFVLRVTFAVGTIPDPLALSALEHALASCPEGASEQQVSALSLLSWTPPYALDMEQSKMLSGRAVTLAGELASAAALREALHARLYALSGPDDIDALLAAADALQAVPGERSPWVAVEAMMASYRAHLYRCDIVAADATLAAMGREAQEHGLAEFVWQHDFFRAQSVFSSGDFASSETLFAELAERGARLQLSQAPLLGAVANTLLTYERGREPGALERGNLDALLAGLLALPAGYAATGARLAAELGRPEIARQVLYQLSQHHFSSIVKDLGYVNALANLSVVSVVLGDRQQAEALYEQLSPYPHHNTPSGAVGFFEGSASRFLAVLAAFLGENARAERHFDDALALNERIGALPQVAHTCYEYARWLLSQGRKAPALALKRRASELTERLGMLSLSASTRAL